VQRQTYVAIREKNMNIMTRLRTKRLFRVANILGAPSLKRWILDAFLSGTEAKGDHVRSSKTCFDVAKCGVVEVLNVGGN
jgi:hypothetical protein